MIDGDSSLAKPTEPEAGGCSQPLVIGVTGHRPERLSEADPEHLRARIEEILAMITANGDSPAVLSPLAEGADRIVAIVALDAGLQLRCVLPFLRDEYALDFSTTASRVEFHELLSRAQDIVELAGSMQSNDERQSAYAAVGASTVQQSDILLAIWDGHTARGEGGTGDVVSQGLRLGRPVVWIKPDSSISTRILIRNSSGETEVHPLMELRAILASF